MIDIASILGVLGGLLAGVACFGTSSGGNKQAFSETSNSSYTPQTSYTYSYEYPTRVSYIDPNYNRIFRPLFGNNSNSLNLDIGFSIDASSVSSEDWVQFRGLVQTNDEFSIYAEQLLDSQCWNLIQQNNWLFNVSSGNFPEKYKVFYCVDQLYKLKEYINFKSTSSSPNVPEVATMVREYTENESFFTELCFKYFNTSLQIFNSRFELMLDNSINSKNFLTNYVQQEWELFDLKDTLSKLVRGSLDFWKWKNNRKFVDWRGKRPFRLNNGGRRCWLQTGVQLLVASSATDDFTQLGNWGRFLKFLSDYQEVVKNDITFIDKLISFCNSDQFDYTDLDSREISNTLAWLNSNESAKGSSTEMAVKILFKIFPELKAKKFDTQQCILKNFKDAVITTDGIKQSGTKTAIYMPAPIAVRHFIPGLNSVNDGIGSDPDKNTVTNRYGEYYLQYDLRGRLRIYELRAMSLEEYLATGRIVEDYENKKKYYSKPPIHGRAVIKLDNSSYWHYCDSNDIYFCKKSLKNIFLDNLSIMDYSDYRNLQQKPANHSGIQLYSLVSKEDWDDCINVD